MKLKKEEINQQIVNLRASRHYFNIIGTLVAAGGTIAFLKENNITLASSVTETANTLVPLAATIGGGALLGISRTFKGDANNFEEKLKHQHELEKLKKVKEAQKIRKRHYL